MRFRFLLLLLLLGCEPPPAKPKDKEAARKAVQSALQEMAVLMTGDPAPFDEVAAELYPKVYSKDNLPAPRSIDVPAVTVAEPDDALQMEGAWGERKLRLVAVDDGGWKLKECLALCQVCGAADPDCPDCEGSGYAPFLHTVLPRKPKEAPKVQDEPHDLSSARGVAEALINLRRTALVQTHGLRVARYEEALGWARRHLPKEAADELVESLSEVDEVLPPRIVKVEADRRRAIVYVGLSRVVRSAYEEGEIAVSIRIRMRRFDKTWRVIEEAIFCTRCKTHKDCGSCESTGIMLVVDAMAVCNACRAGLDCKVCDGKGYVTGFSLLRVGP